jgi:UPF0176 protein
MSSQLESQIVVVAMYQFVQLDDFMDLKPPLLETCVKNGLMGTILLAREGLNGTIAGTQVGVDNFLSYIITEPRFKTMGYKLSYAETPPFQRMKVKLKREIVTMGVPDTDPGNLSGRRVNGREWNELLKDPNVLIIDTRNIYEYEVGTFENAISSETETFREFPKFVDTRLDPQKNKKIAMFCTGGIRCEKASNYMIKKGFKEVYHLDGGILQYLKTVDKKESLWQGECFVFDDRVTVGEELVPGSCVLCHACRRPLSKSDLNSTLYEVGVSCHHCHGKHGAKKIAGLRERQRQYEMVGYQKKASIDGSSKS